MKVVNPPSLCFYWPFMEQSYCVGSTWPRSLGGCNQSDLLLKTAQVNRGGTLENGSNLWPQWQVTGKSGTDKTLGWTWGGGGLRDVLHQDNRFWVQDTCTDKQTHQCAHGVRKMQTQSCVSQCSRCFMDYPKQKQRVSAVRHYTTDHLWHSDTDRLVLHTVL